MLQNAFIDPLKCEITHRVRLFFSFVWYTASLGLLFLWGKIASFFGCVAASSCFRRRCRPKPTVVIGELFVLRGGRITPLATVQNHQPEHLGLPSSPSSSVASSSSLAPSSSAAPSSTAARYSSVGSSSREACFSSIGPTSTAGLTSSAVLSSSVAASGYYELSKAPFSVRPASVTSIKLNMTCYSLDCACVAGLPCLSGGRMPSFRPPLQRYSSSVSFGIGCEAITKACLKADVGSLGFGRDCSPSVVSSLTFGQAFPLGDFAASSRSLPAVDSAMDVDDVSVPVSGESGVLGLAVASATLGSGLSAASSSAAEELCHVSVSPLGDNVLSAPVFLAGAEIGSVVGSCSAGADSAVAEVPAVALPRPVAIPRRLGSGRCVAVSSAVVADAVAGTAVDAPLASPPFSPSPCEKRQRGDKRKNDAPPPTTTVRPCFVPRSGDVSSSVAVPSVVTPLSVLPTSNVGFGSSVAFVTPVTAFSSVAVVPPVSCPASVSSVSSVSSVPVIEGSSITVSPVRPIAKPRVAHYEKARERLVLKALFDRAEKEEEEADRKEKEKADGRSSSGRR
ncbi:uncharacterized protein EV154DRAFT_564332 [Mucor mucedo]|uniref:uncharacterized protein n=1 Tax=Mucor mucedo TaxID=29922 RepID=UPI00221E3B70|nr:uncharacterized protein EV154DRAFT_564332 [Mucor mucedo]KAI7890452.1 hypothetical protein EV154DRAFT_564332 [Mucor mucedo]